ncbi:hypothetical protein HK100_007106, partial [Physocladia obscura]
MGKTTLQESKYIAASLSGLTRRPARYTFDIAEGGEAHGVPAASRPFELVGLSANAQFSISVKALKGHAAPVAVGGLSGFTLADALKHRVARLVGADAASLRLVFKGRALHGAGKTLADFGLAQGAVVHLMITQPSATAKPAAPAADP